MDRRAFLTSVAAGWLVNAAGDGRRPLDGRIVGASHRVGHVLRDGSAAPTPTTSERADVVIVGGGVSGLSAAWRLAAAGLDVRVLELEDAPGGTSAWGEDGVSPHPWGAHYLAAPNIEARAALRLLSQMGVVRGWDAAGRPIFDGRVLCHAPQERLFYQGEWHQGLSPADVVSAAERAELDRFHEIEQGLTEATGSDGRAAFQIPLEQSSRDPKFTSLDRITMAAWLEREGFKTPFLRWYVRYATLDDFGATPDDVSAWAGLHYFAARKLRSPELDGSHFLAWPEGNGRLIKGLIELGHPRIHAGELALNVAPTRSGVQVISLSTAARTTRRFEARAAILATPAFVTRRLFPDVSGSALPSRVSSPWLVANLHVRRPFDPDLAWDSVLYDADGLGYVDARHQTTEPLDQTVLTYYRAYGDADTTASRSSLVRASWGDLASAVLRNLAPAHPELREDIDRMDLMIWGHGMPRPRVGFLGAAPFEAPCELSERIAWAHVDQSGMALFEEAQARGVRAAETLGRAIGVELGETWL